MAQTKYPTNGGGVNLSPVDYGKTGGKIETKAITEEDVTALSGDGNKAYLVLSTNKAGFNGTFKLLTVKVGSDDVLAEQYTPDKGSMEVMTGGTFATPAGISDAYGVTANVDLNDKNLKKGDKIKVYYEITGKGAHPFRVIYGRANECTGKDDSADITDATGSVMLTVGTALTSSADGHYRVAVTLKNDTVGGFDGSVKITKIEITPAAE